MHKWDSHLMSSRSQLEMPWEIASNTSHQSCKVQRETLCHMVHEQCTALRLERGGDDASHQAMKHWLLCQHRQEVSWLKCEEKMEVRKTTLLEFDGVKVCEDFTKDVHFRDVMKEHILIHVENSYCDVWSVCSTLAWKESFCYLWPHGVCSECNEEVKSTIKPCNHHRILEKLIHISRTPNKGRWKDHLVANIVKIKIVIQLCNGIFKPAVQWCT